MKKLIALLFVVCLFAGFSSWGGGWQRAAVPQAAAMTGNGFVGYSGSAESTGYWTTSAAIGKVTYSSEVCTRSGWVSWCHFGQPSSGTATNVNVALHDSTGALLGDSTTLASALTNSVNHMQLDSPVYVYKGSAYKLVRGTSTVTQYSCYYSINPATGYTTYLDNTYTVGDTMDSSLVQTDVNDDNYRLKIWFTNTADGT